VWYLTGVGKIRREGGLIALFSCAPSRPHEFVGASPTSLLALQYPFLLLGLYGFQTDSFQTTEKK